jgi:P-type Cu2+ transporter
MIQKATVEVRDLFSVLSARGIEKQLMRLAGVTDASVNPVSEVATVAFEPSKIDLAEIRSAIEACGHHCAGESLPRHLCDAPAGQSSDTRAPVADAIATETHHHPPRGAGQPPAPALRRMEGAKTSHGLHAVPPDTMAHGMGHGAGMDMQAMVRDMRNRFLIALAFSLPIFAYSPMGMDFIRLTPPFGMRSGRSSSQRTARSETGSRTWRCSSF